MAADMISVEKRAERMNNLKTKNDPADLETDGKSSSVNGSHTKYIYKDINHSGTLILFTTSEFKVELRTHKDLFVRYIREGNAQHAKFYGDFVIILTSEGLIELRNLNGELVLTVSK